MRTNMRRAAVALALAMVGIVAPPTGGALAAQSRDGTTLDSLTVTYDVGGVKVIHRPVSATDVVAVNLYLLGGVRQASAANAGVEPFLLYASEYGTRKYPGNAARLALAHTGSWITVSATADYTRYSFRGIKQEFDSTWAVFAARLLHPTLDSAAIAITRGQLLPSIRSASESPDGHVAQVADSLAFESHPYAIPTGGTERSIAAMTADAMRKFAAEQMITSRMLLVVVGDIPRAQVERAVTATLATLPRGSYSWSLPAEWPAKAPRVALIQRKIPTNYILGYFSGPLQSSPDYPAFAIAVGYLGGILQDVIRSEGLSYAAGAPLLERGATGGGVYVSTVRPDTVVKIINTAIDFIQREALPRAALIKHSQRYVNSYHYRTESNAELADVLAMAQLYRGDFHAAAEYGAVLRRVSGGDVTRVARKYIRNIQYGFVGDTTRAPVKLMLKP